MLLIAVITYLSALLLKAVSVQGSISPHEDLQYRREGDGTKMKTECTEDKKMETMCPGKGLKRSSKITSTKP